jgi:Tol biopolymer transport system component
MIRVAVFCLLIIAISQGCCNVCDPVEGNINKPSEIWLTARSLNSDQPSVFGINSDGSGLKEIIGNATIFSAPSKSGKFALLRSKSATEIVVLSYDSKSDSLIQIASDNYYSSVNLPVISPDGAFIAFVAGKDSLLLAKGTLHEPLSDNFCPGTLPTFSPDGSMVAFIEGDSLSEPLRVKILKTANTKQIFFEKQFSFGIRNHKGVPSVDWSGDGSLIAYTITDEVEKSDVVYIHNSDTYASGYKMIDFGAFNPVISPDKKSFAFVANDLNIWTRNISNDPRYFRLTNIDTTYETCNYPKWSPDAKDVLYIRFAKNKPEGFNGALSLANIEKKSNYLILNNVFRAFWAVP